MEDFADLYTLPPPADAPPAWDSVAESYQRDFPDLDQGQLKQRYESARQLGLARRQAAQQESEDPKEWIARRMVPVASAVHNIQQDRAYHAARQRYETGASGEFDARTIAEHEQRQKIDSERGFGGKLLSALGSVPAMAGEAALGGMALRGAAAAAPRVLGFLAPAAAAEAGVAVPAFRSVAGLSGALGRTAAQTVLMPSMYMEQAAHNNLRQGRDPLDPTGFPAALGLGMIQTAVLGQVAGKIPSQGLKGLASRSAAGVLEQQAGDIASSTVAKLIPRFADLDTGYGVLGQFLDGKKGEAAQHAAIQYLTFAAFGLLHGPQRGAEPAPTAPEQVGYQRSPTDRYFRPLLEDRGAPQPVEAQPVPVEPVLPPPAVLQAFADLLNHDALRQVPMADTLRQARQIADTLHEHLDGNPNPTYNDVARLYQDMDPGPARDLAMQLANTFAKPALTERTPERQQLGYQPTEKPPPLEPPGPGPQTPLGPPPPRSPAAFPETAALEATAREALPPPEAQPAAAPQAQAEAPAEPARAAEAEPSPAEPPAEDSRDEQIYRALRSGLSTRTVGKLFGISHEKARQIGNAQHQQRAAAEESLAQGMAARETQAAAGKAEPQRFTRRTGETAEVLTAKQERDAVRAALEASELTDREIQERLDDESFHNQIAQEYNDARKQALRSGHAAARVEEVIREGENAGAGGPPAPAEGAETSRPARSWRDYLKERLKGFGKEDSGALDLDWLEQLPGQAKKAWQKLAERFGAGEDVTLAEVYGAAGLSAKEQHLLQERLAERTLDDIAQDGPMAREGKMLKIYGPGAPSRESLRQMEEKALQKLGIFESLAKTVHESGRQDRLLGAAERGKMDLSLTQNVQELGKLHKRGSRRLGQGQLLDEIMEVLANKYIKEKEQAGGKLSAEREAHYQTESARLDRKIQEHLARAERKAQGVSGQDSGETFWADESGALKLDVLKRWGQEGWDRLKSAAAHFRDNWAEIAGQMGPRTTRLSRLTGEALAHVNAIPVYTRELARDLIDKVLGEDASRADRKRYGAVITEMHLRHTQKAWQQKAQDLQAAGHESFGNVEDWQKAVREAQKHAEAVTSVVGKEGSPLTSEADYQEALKDPRLQKIVAAWKEHMVPLMERHFRAAQGMEDSDPIRSFTQIPDFPVNLKSLAAGETGDDAVVKTGAGQGNLKGTYQGKLQFAQERKGNASNYDIDLGRMIEHSLSHGYSRAAKASLFRTAQQEGIGRFGTPGHAQEGEREIPHVFPPRGTQEAGQGESSFYIHEPAYDEFRRALKVDQKIDLKTLKPINDLLTKSSLASTVEFVYHGKNLLTFLFKPGVSPAEFLQSTIGVIRGDKELRSRLVELARIGALKGEGAETGLLLPADYKKLDPTYWAGATLDVLQRGMRLAGAAAFERLSKRPGVDTSETAQRDFLNQLGQYLPQAQQKAVRLLRETGFGPFATAGSNYWAQGLRALYGEHGLKTTTWSADLALRAETMARVLGVAGSVAALNYLLWKRVDGDDKTPLGALKLADREGKAIYLDLVNLTGLTRGLRQTGLLAMVEGGRREQGEGKKIDRATENILHGLIHPGLGPLPSFAWTAATGKNTLGVRVADKPPLGGSETAQNLKAAVGNFNPTVATLLGTDKQEPGIPALAKLLGTDQTKKDSVLPGWTRLLGPFTPRESGQDPAVRNYYDRMHELEDHRRSSVERKAGMAFAQEGEYRRLHAFRAKMDQLSGLLKGEYHVEGRVLAGPKPDAERAAQLRQMQVKLAKLALGKEP